MGSAKPLCSPLDRTEGKRAGNKKGRILGVAHSPCLSSGLAAWSGSACGARNTCRSMKRKNTRRFAVRRRRSNANAVTSGLLKITGASSSRFLPRTTRLTFASLGTRLISKRTSPGRSTLSTQQAGSALISATRTRKSTITAASTSVAIIRSRSLSDSPSAARTRLSLRTMAPDTISCSSPKRSSSRLGRQHARSAPAGRS